MTLDDPFKSLDMLFNNEDDTIEDDTSPKRAANDGRLSAPPKLTSLGGRRVSADFMLLPGNDQFMKAFSPMKAKDAKVPTVFKQHSAPGLLRTKSLSALIDASTRPGLTAR